MLLTYRSNFIECLIEKLLELANYSSSYCLEKNIIVVQSNNIADWLKITIANKLGICANIAWVLPKDFLSEIIKILLKDEINTNKLFDKTVMTWQIMALLQDLQVVQSLGELKSYITDYTDDVFLYELSLRITNCFTQYLFYRNDIIEQWNQGKELNHWQAKLWYHLTSSNDHLQKNDPKIYELLIKYLDRGITHHQLLPTKIFIFNILALPPLYQKILEKLAKYIDIYWFLVEPSLYPINKSEPHHLLKIFGDYKNYLSENLKLKSNFDVILFQKPANNNLLQCLQFDIQYAVNRVGGKYPKQVLKKSDNSLQIHICHSTVREVEVLYDQLMILFHKYPDLSPDDVMIGVPSIKEYDYLIRTIFSTPSSRKLSVNIISDMPNAPEKDHVLSEFFVLLDSVAHERFTANLVISLLEIPIIRLKFNFSDKEIKKIFQWVRKLNICWGLNGYVKNQLNLPETTAHTWQSSLDCLLLGSALLHSDRLRLYKDILPYDTDEDDTQILGNLNYFIESLYRITKKVKERMTIGQWVNFSFIIIKQFFLIKNTADIELISKALNKLQYQTTLANYNQPINFAVFRSALHKQVGNNNTPTRNLGSINVCSITAMRGIPFPVICILGMQENAYPRRENKIDFNLIYQSIRNSDYSSRQDDYYNFIEILLSARRVLYISYVGKNYWNNSINPPSICIKELLSTIKCSFYSVTDFNKQIIFNHPAHSFEQKYCQDNYIVNNQYDTNKYTINNKKTYFPRLNISTSVYLEHLTEFFEYPARWLIQKRLHIYLPYNTQYYPTNEPFLLKKGQYNQLVQKIVSAQGKVTNLRKLMIASNLLPHGQVGNYIFDTAYLHANNIIKHRNYIVNNFDFNNIKQMPIQVVIDNTNITGLIDNFIPNLGRITWYPMTLISSGYINLWIKHLITNIVANKMHSYWLNDISIVTIQPVQNPEYYLAQLLELYKQGLNELLPFVSTTLLKFLKNISQNTEIIPSKVSQISKFYKEKDPYYRLAFANSHDYAAFEHIETTILKPLFDNIKIEYYV